MKRTDSAGNVQTYGFTYDGFNNLTQLTVGAATYSYIYAGGSMASINPLSCRGCYDTETGMYYLQSRYYASTGLCID